MAIRRDNLWNLPKILMNTYFLSNSRRTCRIDDAASSRMLHEKKFAWGWILPPPSPLPLPPCRIGLSYENSKPGYSTVNIYQKFGMYWKFFQNLVKKCFSGIGIKSIFQMFSDNFHFSESSEIFRNIFRANFQKFKFSNFLHISVFHCVFSERWNQ